MSTTMHLRAARSAATGPTGTTNRRGNGFVPGLLGRHLDTYLMNPTRQTGRTLMRGVSYEWPLCRALTSEELDSCHS